MVDQPGDGEYPEYWEADVVLRDGGTAHLRPIHPTDADAVQTFHTRQSQNSIYMRFFAFKERLSSRELKRFTEVDYRDRVAFVITIGGDIIGIGRYDRLDDPAEAEVAFNIADAHQGRGIGSILLEHLAAAARENGIRRFSAEVLPENRKMLMVFSDAGYDVKRHFDDGVVSLEFNIDPTDKSRAVMEAREHRAEARSVQDLLAPSSVAVIGASRRWGTVGYQLLEHIIEGGFTGPVYAINPEAFELAGMLSFGKLSEVPGPVQLAIVAVPYEEVPKVVDECAAAGVKGVLVASAGFTEDGERGLARQRELVRQARANGMRVIGPASLGIVNTNAAVSLNASMAPSLAHGGGLGLFSQSAAIGVALYAASSRRRAGISTFLSAGNRADVSGNDMMQFWEDDADTTAVGLYLESIGNPRKFSRIARRLARYQARDRGQVHLHGAAAAARPCRANHPGSRGRAGLDDAPVRRDPGGDHRTAHGRGADRVRPAAPQGGRGGGFQQLRGAGESSGGQRRVPRPGCRGARDGAGPRRRHVPCPARPAGPAPGSPGQRGGPRRSGCLPSGPRPDRGEDCRGARRILRRSRKACGGGVHRHPRSVGVRGRHGGGWLRRGTGAVLLKSGGGGGRPVRRGALRRMGGTGPGPLCGSRRVRS